jgi:hypothetical protein
MTCTGFCYRLYLEVSCNCNKWKTLVANLYSAVPTYLAETGVEIEDRGPANAVNAAMLITGGESPCARLGNRF